MQSHITPLRIILSLAWLFIIQNKLGRLTPTHSNDELTIQEIRKTTLLLNITSEMYNTIGDIGEDSKPSSYIGHTQLKT